MDMDYQMVHPMGEERSSAKRGQKREAKTARPLRYSTTSESD